MSLPSGMVFYKDGQEVAKAFINCGLSCTLESVKRAINTQIDMLKFINKYNFEWDEVMAYGEKFKKEDL